MSSARPGNLPRLLGQVIEGVQRGLYERLADAGFDDLRPAHGVVFQVIDAESGSRLTDLARGADMSKQAMGELVAHLEQTGYLVRRPDPSDGRAKLVVLTARGGQAMSMATAAFEAIETIWGDRVGAPRLQELRATLTEIVDATPA